jgi:dolichol-phosphate mannosyltransferase
MSIARNDIARPETAVPADVGNRLVISLATFNEVENLRPLVETIRRFAPGAAILVVDDNSPDGTGAIADRLAAELDIVEVLHRPGKAGLGQAYLAGFERALASGADRVIEMDADFSHDPKYLGPLLEASQTADLVLGSRYVPGGGVRDWGWVRRMISRGGGIYARLVLGVKVHDLTGGFKCIRREVLEAIDMPSVRATGYVFQIEVTYRAVLAGFRVVEVPIIFKDRHAGTSKMSTSIALEAMLLVPRLRRTVPNAIATRSQSHRGAL